MTSRSLIVFTSLGGDGEKNGDEEESTEGTP